MPKRAKSAEKIRSPTIIPETRESTPTTVRDLKSKGKGKGIERDPIPAPTKTSRSKERVSTDGSEIVSLIFLIRYRSLTIGIDL